MASQGDAEPESKAMDFCEQGAGVLMMPGNAADRLRLGERGLSETFPSRLSLPDAYTFGLRHREDERSPAVLRALHRWIKSRGKAWGAADFPDCKVVYDLETGVVKYLWATGLVLLMICGGLSGQQNAGPGFDTPPVTGLQDDENALGRNPDARRRVLGMIQQVKRDHDYQIYVVMEDSLISSSVDFLSAKLQREWLPEGNGLVIVFETDTGQLGFGRDMDAKGDMTGGGPSVPTFEVMDLLLKALEDSREDQEEVSALYIEKLLSRIVANLNEYFTERSKPVGVGRSFRLGLATVGVLSVLVLCGMGLGWMMAKAGKKAVRNRRFPEMEQPERLGAPYGAAVTSHYYGAERKI